MSAAITPTAQLATVATAIAGSNGAPKAIRLIVANAVVISINAIMLCFLCCVTALSLMMLISFTSVN